MPWKVCAWRAPRTLCPDSPVTVAVPLSLSLSSMVSFTTVHVQQSSGVGTAPPVRGEAMLNLSVVTSKAVPVSLSWLEVLGGSWLEDYC